MIRSMTGYGRGRAAEDDAAILAEVRSVNARGREVRFRLPQELYATEDELRQQVQAAVLRGRIDVVLNWDGAPPSAARFALNPEGAKAMLAAWRALADAHGFRDEPTAHALLSLPGVVEAAGGAEQDLERLARIAGRALTVALEAHRAAREREGRQLADDLGGRARTIATLVDEIAQRLGDTAQRALRTMRERLQPLLGELAVDEQRLAQELALLAQKSDVTEELVRLRAHLARLDALFAHGAVEIGRTLEFLVQEIRREVNTLSAKTGDPEIDERTLKIRAELERIREQAANLE